MTSDPRYATNWQDAVIPFRGFRGGVRKYLRDLTISGLQLFDFRRRGNFLRCLACHYVFDNQRAKFARMIRMLKQQGTFVDTDTCLNMLEGNRPVDGPYFHLSFDDGFRNVVTNAAPILQEEGVPAIFFVPSSLIGADLEQARDYAVNIARHRAPIEMASWDELKQAMDAGLEIGSHTCTHVRLSTLSGNPDGLRAELAESKLEIENRLGVKCNYIAYPFGKPGDYDQLTLDTTREVGYRAGFGIHRGTVHPRQTHPMIIPRHHFEPEWPLSHLRYFANGNMEEYWSRKMQQFA